MKQIICAFLLFLSFNLFAMDKFCNGAPTLIHTNGGGHVAITAVVASTAFVGPDAAVCEYAMVFGNSEIKDNAIVFGGARIGDGAVLSGKTRIFGNAIVSSGAVDISGNVRVFDNARISKNVILKEDALIFENALVTDTVQIKGSSKVFGFSTISNEAVIQGNAQIHGNAYIGGNVLVDSGANICIGKYFEEGTVLNTSLCTVNSVTPYLKDLTVGDAHTCILLADKIKCWGRGNYGQLGYGNTNSIIEIPLKIEGISISTTQPLNLGTGSNHSCFNYQPTSNTGRIVCWGYNLYGQLGTMSMDNIGDDEAPLHIGLDVEPSMNFIALGNNHTCIASNAIQLSDVGKVRCWGRNNYGQLGYANTNDTGTNNPLSTGFVNINTSQEAITQIVAGGDHTCVLMSGKLRCWGKNDFGQLGLGNTNNIGDDELPSSTILINLDGYISKIAAGKNHTCAIVNQRVYCWGRNDFGQLGLGHTNNIGDTESPMSGGYVSLPGNAQATDVFAGGDTTCVQISSPSRIVCWGRNDYGQLGQGHTNNIGDNELPSSLVPLQIPNTGPLELAIGLDHVCIANRYQQPSLNMKFKCWGRGSDGQLGYGSTSDIFDPNIQNDIYYFYKR